MRENPWEMTGNEGKTCGKVRFDTPRTGDHMVSLDFQFKLSNDDRTIEPDKQRI